MTKIDSSSWSSGQGQKGRRHFKMGMSFSNSWTKFMVLILLLISWISQLDASPLRQSSRCGPAKCISGGKGGKFHYKDQHVYVYRYVINGTTSIEGGPTEQSGLHLSSQVTIKFLSACDAILFMTNVELHQSHRKSGQENLEHTFTPSGNKLTLGKSLEQFPLRFSYADGLIEEICPESGESAAALNLKRGLLSAFQNTMRRLDLEHKGQEDDVHGHCRVAYELGTATSSSLTLVKIKDINSCGDRFGVFSSVQGVPYNFGTLHQSMPAVASTSECEQVVDRNLLSEIKCRETHRLKSLSRGTAGASTNIVQSIELLSVHIPPKNVTSTFSRSGLNSSTNSNKEDEEEDEDSYDGPRSFVVTNLDSLPPKTILALSRIPEKISRRDSLHFRQEYGHRAKQGEGGGLSSAKETLSLFCLSVKDQVTRASGQLFDQLVHKLQTLSTADLTSLAKEATGICRGDRVPFDDALEATGTAASIDVIRDKILRKEAPPATIKSWIASLTYIAKPSVALLENAVHILKARDDHPEILLTFSTLAHAYCRAGGEQSFEQNNKDNSCARQPPVAKLLKLYEIYFQATKCMSKKPRDTDQILMYLKGMGNFGQFSPGIEQAILMCVGSEHMEIRVAAIEAYRRMPCGVSTSILERLFLDQRDDSEVRIAAFIGLMRCPSYATIRFVKKALDNEQVNQVGSFVWTYLKNLQETALPSKAELQGLLADEILSSKFSPDVRKFSRNFEISSFYDDFNFGVGVDSNVIYSQHSYVPRSSSLNLTIDLFGESINVLEANIRLESFESYVESLFGPNGKYNSKELYNFVSSFRERRAVASKRKLRTLSLEYEAGKRYYSDPIASLSLKTFGNEILYRRKVGVDEQSDFLQSLNPFEYLKRLQQDKDTNWQKSTSILDSSYIIPTGVGLPLNLSAQASTILRVEAMSMIDAENFLSNSQLKLKGKLQPSALLSVTGGLALGVSGFETGIKIRAQIRTSIAVEGSFHVKGSQLLHAEFGIPQSQVDVLEYSSELLFQQGDEYKKVGQIPAKALTPHCTDSSSSSSSHSSLLGLLGLKLCGQSYFTLSPTTTTREGHQLNEDSLNLAPYFPLNGPAQFTLSVQKAHPDLMRTRIKYEWTNDQKSIKLMGGYEKDTKAGPAADEVTTEVLGVKLDLDKEAQTFQFGLTSMDHVIESSGELRPDGSKGQLELSLKTKSSSAIPIVHTILRFEHEATKIPGKGILRPTALLTYNTEKIIDLDSELTLSHVLKGTSFEGKGFLRWRREANYNLDIRGFRNASSLSLSCDADYRNGGAGGKGETIRWKIGANQIGPGGGGLSTTRSPILRRSDASISLELSEFPDYNLDASWRHQINEDGLETETEVRVGPGPSWNDRTALKLHHLFVWGETHEGRKVQGLFRLTQLSKQIDVGLDVGLTTRGHNLESAINLRYAPDRNLASSLYFVRGSGVLTFLQIGWNITLVNQEPLKFTLHLQEKTHRIYESLFNVDWFGSNNVTLAVDYHDKGRRHLVNKFVRLAIQTKSTDPLKLTAHLVHQDEKETKIQLGTEYGSKINSIELGHSQTMKGKRHRLHASLQQAKVIYLVSAEVETDAGFKCVIQTDFSSKFADIYMSTKASHQDGMQLFTLDYKWDATRDKSKHFLLDFFLDSQRPHLRRSELVLTLPGRQFLVGGDYNTNPDDGARVLTGRVKWDDRNHLHVNAHLVPDPDAAEETEAYRALIQLQTPFASLKNATVASRFEFVGDETLFVSFNGTWGVRQKLAGALTSTFSKLVTEEGEGENEDESNPSGEAEEGGEEEEEEEDDDDNLAVQRNGGGGGSRKNQGSPGKKAAGKFTPFTYSLQANFTSTIPSLESVRLNLNHNQYKPLHLKTDVDIQLPSDKEISIGSHWLLPRTLDQVLSSRAELRVKTPFVGYQNMNLQAIVGHQEDADILAVAGLYLENLQYSITITGTPRFEEDGALGFDITTSDPKYDKIFGSMSYAFSEESSRFACQLGWPQVVIGLETALELTSWEEFQAHFTFTSPWMPLKNINALAKIDSSQAEIKVEVNEEGVNGKCEWLVESLKTMEIRVDASTPLKQLEKFGMILKNALEEESGIHSQAVLWVNDKQVGYKVEGEQSEVDEEDAVAKILSAQVELDLAVYPTIRSTVSLEQRDNKFNLGLSLLLREGPINVSGELHLLDVFRFNEKITITTPFPSLLELEINLTPAVMPDNSLYNIGVNSRWRSGSDWKQGGLVIRYGDQNVLLEALAFDSMDAEEGDEEEPAEGEEHQGGDEGEDEDDHGEKTPRGSGPTKKPPLTVPNSQLFHFYSPISWAQEVKLEYEDIPEDQLSSPNDFPYKSAAVAFSAEALQISGNLRNELLTKSLATRLTVPHIAEPVSLGFESNLELGTEEKKFNLLATNYNKHDEQVSFSGTWEKRSNYLRTRAELHTPLEDFEEQYAQLMYAHNEPDDMYTVDVELSNSGVGKLESNFLLEPGLFEINIESPIQNYETIKIKGNFEVAEGSSGSSKETVTSLITISSGEDGRREIQIDVESLLEEKWPTQVKGTISNTFYRRHTRGNVTGTVRKTTDAVNAQGTIDYGANERVTASLFVNLPQRQFKELDIKIATPYKNWEALELSVVTEARPLDANPGDNENEEEEQEEEEETDDNDNENENDDEGDRKSAGKKQGRVEHTLKVRGKSPWTPFTKFEADGSLELGSGLLDVRKAIVTGKNPGGSVDLRMGWLIEQWNNFGLECNASYFILHSSSPLPRENFVKLKVHNKVPSLDSITRIDSLLAFETIGARLGGGIFLEHESGESLTVRLSSKLPGTGGTVELKARFDEELKDVDAYLTASTLNPSNDNLKSSFKLTRGDSEFEGTAAVQWAEDDWSSIQSIFNCSYANHNNKVHLELFNPKRKSGTTTTTSSSSISSSNSKTNSNNRGNRAFADGDFEDDYDEDENEDNDGDNNNQSQNQGSKNGQRGVRVNLVLDGSSNVQTGHHTARVQTGEEGDTITLDLHVGYNGPTDIDSSLNVTSAQPRLHLFNQSVSTAGFHIANKILGSEGQTFEGVYGGHWGESEGSVNYNVDVGRRGHSVKLDSSFTSKLPYIKNPAAAIQIFYQRRAMNTEGKLRAELNGTQLIGSNYSHSASSSAGLHIEKHQLDLDNSLWPLGIASTYQYNYSGGHHGLNLPTTTRRIVEVYDLAKPDFHRLTGEVKVDTDFNGRTITLIGAHPSRKLELTTNYEFLDNQLLHSTRFTWRPSSSLGYSLQLTNLTQRGKVEHRAKLKVDYPVREVVVDSTYLEQGRSVKITTDVQLNARRNSKKLTGVLLLEGPTADSRRATLIIKHPLLPHDIKTMGEVRWKREQSVGSNSNSNSNSVEGKLSLDYSSDARRKVTLVWNGAVTNPYSSSTPPPPASTSSRFSFLNGVILSMWNLTSDLRLAHAVTNLDVKALHTNRHSSQDLSIITAIDFKNREKLPQKSKIAFELFKQLRTLRMMLSSPEEEVVVRGWLTGRSPNYVAHAQANRSMTLSSRSNPGSGVNVVNTTLWDGKMGLWLEKPYYSLRLFHGKDLKDGFFSEGGVVDSRNVKWDISEEYDSFRFSDVNFFLRMNHSRLVTSKLKWRPDLLHDIKEAYGRKSAAAKEVWSQQSDKLLVALSTHTAQVAGQIWEDAKTVIGPFVQEMRNDSSFESDVEAFQQFVNETVTNNDFYAQEIVNFSNLMAEEISVRFSNIFLRLREFRRQLFGESSQLFEKTVLWILEQLRENYRQLVGAWQKYKSESGSSSLSALTLIRDKLQGLVYQVVEWSTKWTEEAGQVVAKYGRLVMHHVNEVVEKYKPRFLSFAHRIETSLYGFFIKIADYLYSTRDEVMKSDYFKRLAVLADDVDQLYKDLSLNDAPTNIRKYYNMLKNFVTKKYLESDYGEQIKVVRNYLWGLWGKVEETQVFQETAKAWNNFVSKARWLAEYLSIDETFQETLVALYMKGGDLIYQTVLEAGARFQSAKTKFVFDADKGLVELEQKLPMPWNAFNETPVFTELPEYQNVLKLQKLFGSSGEGSFWDVYYKVKPQVNPLNWLPPFDGHAMIVGSDHFFTFDGVSYEFRGTACTYLLAGDLVDGNFSVSIQYRRGDGQRPDSHNIIVTSGPSTIIIDFAQNSVQGFRRGTATGLSLPVQLQSLQAYRDGDILVVENPKQMSISCNLAYRVCQLRVSGWYSRKTAGLLGTMDFEPTTDMIHSNGKPLSDLNDMTKSWDVSDDFTDSSACSSTSSSSQQASSSASSDPKITSTCSKLFNYILSPLQPCFSTVKVDPYVRMCGARAEERGSSSSTSSAVSPVCSSAMAYVSMCQSRGVLVRMPSQCIKCDMNGEEMIDRDVRVIDLSGDPQGTATRRPSTDIVFIVEAKDCNRNLRAARKTDALVKTLESEMTRANFVSNRYSLVVFGGDGVFDKPHPVRHNNQVFTAADNFGQYFSSIVPGNGSRDIFGALSYSLKLRFRPGVSKTFILFPCSTCQPEDMTMDFSAIHHAMLEQDATLHILMNNDFSFENKNHAKKFLGLDANLGFLKADGDKESLRGETKIRKQAKISKQTLGYCSPLALQTNGSIFSGKKLQTKPKNAGKVSTVFSRRVIQTARPADCQTCYCSPDELDGLGKVQCFLCGYPHHKDLEPEVDESSESIEAEQQSKKEEDTIQVPERTNVRPSSNVEPESDEDNGNISEEEDE